MGLLISSAANTAAARVTAPQSTESSAWMMSARPQPGEPLELTVCGSSATFDVDVSTKAQTMIELPRGLDQYSYDHESGYTVTADGNKLYVTAAPNTPDGHEFALRVRGHTHASEQNILFEVSLHTKAVEHIVGVADSVVIYHQSDEWRFGARPEDNPCAGGLRGTVVVMHVRARDRQRDERPIRAIPQIEYITRSGDGPSLTLSLLEWDQGNLAIDFSGDNRGLLPATVTGIEVFDKNDRRLPATLWHWDASGQLLQGQQLTIGGRERASASIFVPDSTAYNNEPVLMKFRGTRGTTPFYTAIQIYRAVPITEEDIEREEYNKQRTKRAKRVAVSLRGVYGALWTDAGDNQGERDATAMAGLGVRHTRGLLPLIAFEVDVMGGRSGAAHFTDVQWRGLTGDVSRQATFARVSGSGVLRFGETYQTSMRAGLGVQLAYLDSTIDVLGNSMDGPGRGLDVAGVWTVGGAFDAHLGDHWILGFGATFANNIDDATRSLEASLQLGYHWLPQKWY